MESGQDREECVYMAKLAEQAERYDEMVGGLRRRQQRFYRSSSKESSIKLLLRGRAHDG